MRLINTDAIVHYQTYDDEHEEFPEHESTIADFLDKMTDEGCPNPVDAAPVVHGRWINGKCDKCGGHAPFWAMATTYHPSNFCPDCGARMDGEDGDGNDR